MTHMRLTVGAVTALAVAASGLALAAPATAYGPASSSVKCRLYFGDTGAGISPSTYTDSFSLTASPASPTPGATVTVTLSGSTGPVGGPVPIAASTMNVRATIDLSGAQTGSVALVSPAYPAAEIPAYTAAGPWSATGTYVAQAGTTSAALKQLKMDDTSFYNADTYCADSATDADFKATGGVVSTTVVQSVVSRPVAEVTGVRADGTTAVPDAAVPGMRVGDAIDIAGDGSWAAGQTLHATICSTDDITSCAPPFAETSLFEANDTDPLPTVDGAGELTAGTLKLKSITGPSGSLEGAQYLQLWQGVDSGPPPYFRTVTKHHNIPVRLLGARTISATPETVLEGDTLTVTGTGWYPGEQVTAAAGNAPLGTVAADATGAISTSGPAVDAAATQAAAAGIGGNTNDPITVTPISSVLTGTYGLSPQTVWLSQATTITPSSIGGAVATVTVNWGDFSPLQSVSKTVKSTHTYAAVGTYQVAATFAHANGRTVYKPLGSVVVKKDTVKPTAALLLPAKAKRTAVASWKTLRGVASDVGLGPKSVQVWLTQKRGAAFYYFTGRGWAKATGAKAAAAKAKRIGVAVAANKTWALGTKGITKGALTISYRAIDKAGNIGATKAHVQALVR